jgi:hypothetical protein
MRPVHVCVREFVRVTEAEVDVRLRREVEDGIDLVLAQHALYVGRGCNVAILKGKISSAVEDSCVVEGCAVVELVEGHDIVVGVGEDKMADEPTGTADKSASILYTLGARLAAALRAQHT